MTSVLSSEDEALDPALAELIAKAEASIEPASGRADLFRRAYDRAQEIGEEEVQEDMRREFLLFSLTVQHMAEPRFAPQLEFTTEDGTTRRFPDLEHDFPNEVLDYYYQRAVSTTNPAMRAWYSDLLWERRKNADMARLAAEAYLEVCPIYHASNELAASLGLTDALWRALGLSLALNDSALRQRSVEAHMFYLRELAVDGRYRWCIDIGESLVGVLPKLKRDTPDGLDLDDLARVLDETATYYHDDEQNFYLERAALGVLERLWRARGEHGRERDTRVRLADSHLAEGQVAEKAGGRSTVAALCYEQALPIWQELRIPPTRINELKQHIRKVYERAASAEYGVIRQEIPVPDDMVKGVVGPYEGLSSQDIVALLSIDPNMLPSYSKAEETVEQIAEYTVLSRLFPRDVMHGGLRSARVSGENESLKFDTILYFRMAYHIYNLAFLTPVFTLLLQDRRAAETAILTHLRRTGIISDDRIQILKSAVRTFLDRDYVSALHILPAQIEGILRDMLVGLGRSTYKIKSGVMSEFLLDEVIAALDGVGLDSDFLKLLQCLLADRRADNLRNEISHGLFPYAGFSRENAQLTLFALIRLASYELKRADEGKDVGTDDLEARAHERGEMEKQAILEVGGAPLTPSQVAARLGVVEGEVEALRAGDKLLGLPVNGEYVYPSWQFQGSDVVPGIEETLQALSPDSPWLRAAFFPGTSDYLGGRPPLTELEHGHLSQVVRAARAIGEHGAA